jgi:hypothetical protein
LLPLAEDLTLPVGTIEGPPIWWEGFGAGLRVWCGPLFGWRDLGELLGQPPAVEGPPIATLLMQRGRLRAGLAWDLGRAKLPRRAVEEEADG